MRNVWMAAATIAGLALTAVPASAQFYAGAGPGGAGVQVGPFGAGVDQPMAGTIGTTMMAMLPTATMPPDPSAAWFASASKRRVAE